MALAGALISGPVALVVVESTRPQPPWQDAQSFAAHFHWVQAAPYLAGMALVWGMVLLLIALHRLAGEGLRLRTAMALFLMSVFATLVSFNYVVQTTFLPALADRFDPADAAIIAALSMANPHSLAWGLEMWGYGFLGVATWLASPVLGDGRIGLAARLAFAANGPVSIAGTAWTVLAPGWVLSATGLTAFGLWNVLLGAMCVLALLVLRSRGRAASVAG